MLIDGRTVADGQRLACDVCIVGGGPAGISLAMALRDRPLKVMLVESGGFDFDVDVQELYRADTPDLPYDLMTMRLRYFGGCSNHWGAYCRPLDPDTFEAKPWIPKSGWPIGRADLDPYYPAAARMCGLPEVEVPAPDLAARWQHGTADFGADSGLRNVSFQIAPFTNFGESYRAPLVDAANVTICLNTTIARLHSQSGAAVEHAEAATLADNRFTIAARAFVLACGGIENARVLLASNGTVATGLGNRHDQVGRHFMDHGHFQLGHIRIADGFDAKPYLEIPPEGDQIGCNVHVALDLATRQRAGIADQAVQFHVREPTPGETSLRLIKEAFKRGTYPDHLASHIGHIIQDLGPVTETLSRQLRGDYAEVPEENNFFALRLVGEQVPNAESRVTLTDQLDRLGVPIAKLEWRLSDLDQRSMATTGQIFADAIAKQGLGRVKLELERPAHFVDGGWHHMGTTRMSEDPRTGVVDRNCKVHEVDNLYMAGSSVFATGGHGVPTMTIVAFALRLAEHLNRRLTGAALRADSGPERN